MTATTGVRPLLGHARALVTRRSSAPARLATRSPRPPVFLALLGLTATLDLIGLVMVLSASSVEALSQHLSSWYYFERQAMWVIIGAGIMAFTLRVDYHRWRRYAGVAMAVSMLLLLAVLVPHVGVSVGGSSRWLGLGQFRVQPSELVKLTFVLYLADVLARRRERTGEVRSVLGAVGLVFAPAALLIFIQPDMGTTMVLTAIAFGVLWAAGLRLKTLAKMTTVGIGLAFLGGMAEPYRKARLLSFLHPWADRATSGYQVVQSMVGLASGGLVGVGLGASKAKWGFLPNAYTDFIFSVIGEELGLLGSVTVVLLFAAFAVVGLRCSRRAPDTFGGLLAVGIVTWITVQAVLNIGAVIGLLPVTGVPLPLVSFGGSSVVILMASIGVLLNIAAQGRTVPAGTSEAAVPTR
ncbi:MAG: putative lipid II flippase FtsW [Acidimicrobiales bacterium]